MPPTNHTQYATRSLLKEGAGSTGGNRSSAPGGGRASQPVRSVKQTMLLRMPAAPSVFDELVRWKSLPARVQSAHLRGSAADAL